MLTHGLWQSPWSDLPSKTGLPSNSKSEGWSLRMSPYHWKTTRPGVLSSSKVFNGAQEKMHCRSEVRNPRHGPSSVRHLHRKLLSMTAADWLAPLTCRSGGSCEFA